MRSPSSLTILRCIFEPLESRRLLAVTLVKDILPGGPGSVNSLYNYNDTLFFSAHDGMFGPELWKSDGTADGTVLVKDINPGGASSPHSFVEVPLVYDAGKKSRTVLFFLADDGTHGYEMWMSDGTETGTQMVQDLRTGIDPITQLPYSSGITNMSRVGSTLFFSADNGTTGQELYRTVAANDGSVTLSLVKDIYSGIDPLSMLPVSSYPSQLVGLGNQLIFSAETASGRELWRSDGTEAGTQMILDLRPGTIPGSDPPVAYSSNPSWLVPSGDHVYFSAYSLDTIGTELYRTDGTSGGTGLVADIWSGFEVTPPPDNQIIPNESFPEWLTDVNGTLFFSAFVPATGRELYKRDPATGTVSLAADIYTGAMGGVGNSSAPIQLRNVRGTLFFSAGNATVGQELFYSDGTTTAVVSDIFPGSTPDGPNSSSPIFLGGCDQLYFSAFKPGAGRELFHTALDPATNSYTVVLEDVVPGLGDSFPREVAFANGLPFVTFMFSNPPTELFKVAPPQPALGTAFDGTNHPASAQNAIVPDPHGAVGPGHVVSVVNRQIHWHAKSGGAAQSSQTLNAFFAATNPAPTASLFDPKVVYNHRTCTFFVVALHKTANTSHIYIAESDDHDPNGKWHFKVINSTVAIGGINRWADYPGLGVGKDTLYITANMFSFAGGFGGVRMWILDTRTPVDRSPAATLVDPAVAAAAGASTFQPAHMYGTARDGLGTFVLSFAEGGANDHLYVVRVDDPLGAAPALTAIDIALGDITSAILHLTAPQAGGNPGIHAASDTRLYNAVWRSNGLWTTNTINPVDGNDVGQATARWYNINTLDRTALSMQMQGNVGGEDLGVGTHTFYPSIMVDSGGNMGLGFAASSPTLFAGAYFTGRRASDPVLNGIGSTRSSRIMRAGVHHYNQIDPADPNMRNRWGDYSGLALDPGATRQFWAFNEYAQTPTAPATGQWGTRWELFSLADDSPSAGLVRGKVFNDANGDGVRQAGEAALTGWTVYIDANNNDMRDAGEPVSVTDAAGNYQFGPLAGGFYTIREEVMVGWRQTSPSNGAAPAVQEFSIYFPDATDFALDREFGNRRLPRILQRNFRFEILPMQISFDFSDDVSASLDLSDIIVQNLTTGSAVNPTALSYNFATNTATFSFDGVLPDGNYRATIAAAGVTDPIGDPLAEDEVFDFFFLMADANHDGAVNLDDFNIVAANFGQSGRNFTQGDFNYDTFVNLVDFNILAARFGATLGPDASLMSRTFADNLIEEDASIDDPVDKLLA